MNSLLTLHTYGQSYWLDNLTRRKIHDGELVRRVATEQGIPAIEEMLFEGININVTLIFSVPQYETVAEAYIRAFERRSAAGMALNEIRSVASFFLSRIDTLVDLMLFQEGISSSVRANLTGRTAIANAKLAYTSFEKIFAGQRWEVLAQRGAVVQRPLWASTGTKNPDHSDVKYVEPLIGNNTVNTMPEATITAFTDHGVAERNSIKANIADAERVFELLEQSGIDMRLVSRQLLREGLKKFQHDFNALLKTLDKKREEVLDIADGLS